jgi:hypothetical protein
LELLNNACS